MENNPTLDQLTKALVARLSFIRDVLSIELFDCGSHCNIYKVTAETSDGSPVSLIVRLPRVDKHSRRIGMHREHVVLRYLESIGYLNAPRSLFHDATLEYLPVPYSVQSFVNAIPLSTNVERVRKLAHIIQNLHSVDISGLYEYGFSFYRTWYEGILVEVRHLAEWIRSSFSTSQEHNFWLAQIKPIMLDAWDIIHRSIEQSQNIRAEKRVQPSLLHGDLGGHNFAWAGETPYLFDWELTNIGDPAFDLAKLFRSELCDITLRNEFLSAYLGESKTLPPDFAERLELYEQIAALQTSIWAVNILASNEDLKIYLTRSHLKNALSKRMIQAR
ncbi:MAG: aminoglycoside phosphotransferase family protein [Candidatus Bathyarchaeia archaeon]